MYKLAAHLVRLNPLDNLGDGVNSILESSRKIGPALGGIALIITIICLIFAGEKRSAAYVRKAIIIFLAIAIIVNLGYVVSFFNWIVKELIGEHGDFNFGS